MNTQPDKSLCPLCGGSNACAMTQADGAQPECWCMKVKIGSDVLAKVPEPAGGAACICARCAAGILPGHSG